jgi:uncharacterized membrane protein
MTPLSLPYVFVSAFFSVAPLVAISTLVVIALVIALLISWVRKLFRSQATKQRDAQAHAQRMARYTKTEQQESQDHLAWLIGTWAVTFFGTLVVYPWDYDTGDLVRVMVSIAMVMPALILVSICRAIYANHTSKPKELS